MKGRTNIIAKTMNNEHKEKFQENFMNYKMVKDIKRKTYFSLYTSTWILQELFVFVRLFQ